MGILLNMDPPLQNSLGGDIRGVSRGRVWGGTVFLQRPQHNLLK